MKTIKQRISYAVMGLMAMGLTACTQNEDMAPTLKGPGQPHQNLALISISVK